MKHRDKLKAKCLRRNWVNAQDAKWTKLKSITTAPAVVSQQELRLIRQRLEEAERAQITDAPSNY